MESKRQGVARIGDLLMAAGLATEDQRSRACVRHRRFARRPRWACPVRHRLALSVQFDVAPAAELEEICADVLKLIPPSWPTDTASC
jgi:hypothetical protein